MAELGRAIRKVRKVPFCPVSVCYNGGNIAQRLWEVHMLRPKRDSDFRLIMTAAEKAALVRLAENDGSSQAGVVRRLVRQAAKRADLWLDDESLSYRGRPDSDYPAGTEL